MRELDIFVKQKNALFGYFFSVGFLMNSAARSVLTIR